MLYIDDMIEAMETREKEKRETERLYKAQRAVTEKFDLKYYYVDLQNPDVPFAEESPASVFKAVSFLVGEDTFITYDAVICNPDLYMAPTVNKNLYDESEGNIFCGMVEDLDISVRQFNKLMRGQLDGSKIDFRQGLYKLAHENEFRLPSGKVFDPLKARKGLEDLVLYKTRKANAPHQDYSAFIEGIIRYDLKILKSRNKYKDCPDLFSNSIFEALYKRFSKSSTNENELYEKYTNALFNPVDEILLSRSCLDIDSIMCLLSQGYLYVNDVILSGRGMSYDSRKQQFVTVPDLYSVKKLLYYSSPVLRVHIPDKLICQLREKSITSFSQLVSEYDTLECEEIYEFRSTVEGALASVIYGTPWKENNKEFI